MTYQYQHFLDQVAQGYEFNKHDYYASLVNHSTSILLDVENRGQVIVAKSLNLPQSKLSSMLQILRVLPSNIKVDYYAENL